MATNYQISIKMSDETLTALTDGGYYLYGFKGVSTAMKGGAPLVWFQSQAYSQSTVIQWQEQYQAYTSSNAIIPNGQISASAAYNIDLKQTLNVTGQSGIGQVIQGGTPGAISIVNQTTPPKQFTCGISQVQSIDDGASISTPLCAFPLYGTGADVMAPIERCLLMFATQQINTGTVIYKAYSQGILADLTGAPQRVISFDINNGWSWGGGSWASSVAPQTDLVPLLISSSTVTAISQKLVA
ncbi:hypothetical protein KH5H1_76290 [Corallococcus caeni]|uniref:Uncharacterized protein n=1 Tax=Corallococcus caeni TaxID=3082388 RepID=A0ABQ6R113_9BACT|nr:hypothetical protein KH5H1_76290 [Corallococcus sp. KH5-1]GMU09985.1 hypothetical protein ASNO1_62390 [Corallococcus sp. NO1]